MEIKIDITCDNCRNMRRAFEGGGKSARRVPVCYRNEVNNSIQNAPPFILSNINPCVAWVPKNASVIERYVGESVSGVSNG